MRRAILTSLAAVGMLGAAVLAIYPPARASLVSRFAASGDTSGGPGRAAGQGVLAPIPPAITVVDATVRTFRDQLFVSGTVIAREEALVGVQIDGLRIAEVLAEDGDRVAAGQVLARLDRTQLDALAAQSTASVARAGAAVQQVRAQVQQYEALGAQSTADLARGRQLGLGVLTQSTLDQRLASAKSNEALLEGARSSLAVSRAELQNQEAQQRELGIRIGRTEVRTPVAGVVSRRSARVGMLAMGASEPLFRVSRDGALDLDADAPDDTLARVRVGMSGRVTLSGSETVLPAVVRLISSEVEKSTRLGRVRIALPSVSAEADPGRIGAFASAVIDIARREGVAVPASAVTRDDGGRVVQVVKQDRVEVRRVETGLAAGDLVEVTAGVASGEAVVARAAAFLRSGDVIRPIRPGSGASSR